MPKKVQIAARVLPDTVNVLTKAADDNKRTLSCVVDSILTAWALEKCYLNDQKPTAGEDAARAGEREE
ncbi:conserved protein of unknown function (plasmid) [Rhodovastum atsumiense]|nr:conserved protein of unknown function [Rhodovastum atsumiense]